MKKEVKYKRLNSEEKNLIYRMYKERVGLRAMARILKRNLKTIQYHIKKSHQY
jgi:transposase-like protein